MPRIKILLVDDQELILESLNIVLSLENDLEVAGLARNGKDALNLCTQHRPDIVLMDINMPLMDGVEACARIKEHYPEIKIIMLTSYEEVDYLLAALSGGAEGYLLKAIRPQDLSAGIRVVHSGGTLISQEIATKMIQNITLNPRKLSRQEDYGLSSREIEVLKKLSSGMRNPDIAEALFLSEGTVKNYISSIYAKLNVKGRREATQKALDAGIK